MPCPRPTQVNLRPTKPPYALSPARPTLRAAPSCATPPVLRFCALRSSLLSPAPPRAAFCALRPALLSPRAPRAAFCALRPHATSYPPRPSYCVLCPCAPHATFCVLLRPALLSPAPPAAFYALRSVLRCRLVWLSFTEINVRREWVRGGVSSTISEQRLFVSVFFTACCLPATIHAVLSRARQAGYAYARHQILG